MTISGEWIISQPRDMHHSLVPSPLCTYEAMIREPGISRLVDVASAHPAHQFLSCRTLLGAYGVSSINIYHFL
jgi:hypothetical protein